MERKIWLLVLLLVWGSRQLPAQFTVPGKQIDSVTCLHAPEQSYALYLPTGYDAERAWPVVFIFEPAARGSLPLQHFAAATDRFGYLLVSSNNSRNGSWEVALEAANALFYDVPRRYTLDTSRIYAAGFSGGARVATAIAMESPRIRGIIACGAAFPALSSPEQRRNIGFDWLGLVGNQDMNYIEMKDTRVLLEEADRPHSLLVFEGPHQWPEPDWMDRAFEWLAWREAKEGLRELGDLPEQINARLSADRAALIAENDWDLLPFLDENFRDFGWEAPELEDKKQQKASAKRLKSEAKTEMEEREFREEITRGFMSNADNYQDSVYFAWWQERSSRIRRLIKSSDPVKSNFGLRMQHYVLGNCIERSMPYFSPRQDAYLLTLYRIWTQIKPEAPFPNYQMARSYARLGEANLALKRLEIALRTGSYSSEKVEQEQDFDSVRDHRRYRKIVEK